MSTTIKMLSLGVSLGALSLTACHRDRDRDHERQEHAAKTISEADAAKVTDATIATWASMDAAKIDALYSPDVAGFDVAAPTLSTDRAKWTKNQEGFAAMKFDKIKVSQSKTQILDGEDFIFSSTSNLTSTTGTVKAMTIRCTDVFRKQEDGKFLIVNEHCSAVPVAPKS